MKIGKVSESVLKHSVLHQIYGDNEAILHGAGIGADCAIFAPSGGESPVICMRESALRAGVSLRDPGGAGREPEAVSFTMRHLIHKCANNLAVSGARPVAAAIVLLLPEDAEPDTVKALMREAGESCEELSMSIAGGQTRVTAGVKVPYGVVTGYGMVSARECRTVKLAKPGQDIVLSKWAGLEGTAYLAGRYRRELLSRYPAYLAEEAETFERYLSIVPEAALAMKSNVCAMHDASEGGIFAALWELAEGAGIGLTIDLKKIPLRQETVEICDCCGANPYELLSGGCLVMTAENGEELAKTLEAENIPAAVIGRTTEGNARIIRNEEEVRYMDRPKTDEIYKERKSGYSGARGCESARK